MTTATQNPGRIVIKAARAAFVHVDEPQPAKDAGGKARYNINLLFDRSTPEGEHNIARVQEAIERVSKEKWKDNLPKFKPAQLCKRDGDLESYDGFAGCDFVSAGNYDKPQVLDNSGIMKEVGGKQKRVWNAAKPGRIYSGCYVNAVLTIWAQDNDFGKRVNASLEVVQFLRDGDKFGASAVDASDYLSDEDVGLVEAGDEAEDDLV